MNTARVRQDYYNYSYTETSYAESPIEQAPVIEGPFYYDKENLVKEMAIRRINKTLSGLLVMLIFTAFISYYFAMTNEVTLNKLRRQITTLNEENSELQNQLDRLKSFNNVDDKMGEYNLLQKAAKVTKLMLTPRIINSIEINTLITFLSKTEPKSPIKNNNNPINR